MEKPITESRPINNRKLSLVVAAVVAVGIVVVSGTLAARRPSGPSLYLAPAKGTYAAGSTVTVEVRENSLTKAVNAVESDLTYPTDKLQFVSIDTTSSAFSVQAENSGGTGTIKIARGTTAPLTGDQSVAKVTFTVLPGSGSVPLAFASTSALLDATTNTSVLAHTTGGSYRISK